MSSATWRGAHAHAAPAPPPFERTCSHGDCNVCCALLHRYVDHLLQAATGPPHHSGAQARREGAEAAQRESTAADDVRVKLCALRELVCVLPEKDRLELALLEGLGRRLEVCCAPRVCGLPSCLWPALAAAFCQPVMPPVLTRACLRRVRGGASPFVHARLTARTRVRVLCSRTAAAAGRTRARPRA